MYPLSCAVEVGVASGVWAGLKNIALPEHPPTDIPRNATDMCVACVYVNLAVHDMLIACLQHMHYIM